MGAKIAETTRETSRMLYLVSRERRFWVFISALAIVTFIRIVSLHFLLTFPTYGIRLFGDGAQVGNLYAVLNPMVIVFLTPLFSVLTSRASSYTMLLIGCHCGLKGFCLFLIGFSSLLPKAPMSLLLTNTNTLLIFMLPGGS